MTFQAARVIGGAGTGKTTMMKGIAEKALQRPEMAGDFMRLGFSSFTRAARLEAATRCGKAWGVPPEELMQQGWFRTAHSVCYRQLQVSRGEMLAGSKEDEKWVSEAVGADVAFAMNDEADGGVSLYVGDPVAAASLNYWSLARNVIRPLREIVEADQSPDAPSAQEVVKRIEMYEQQKRLDGRMDFTDLLSRFAGVKHDPSHGPQEVGPEGLVPAEVVGWIFDEAQDASALLDMVCRRLVTGESCKWAWVVGDPFQCQPAGTPVLTAKGYKDIEDLDEGGDWLIAFNQNEGRFYGTGGGVRFQKACRTVDSGDLLEIEFSDGTKSTCTTNHQWYVRTQRTGNYAVYLMRKGDRWRVGTVQMFSKTKTDSSKAKNGEFRLKMRMNQEDADSSWILKVFDTDKEARIYEQVVSYGYGIPQTTFRPPSCKSTLTDQAYIDQVFAGIGDITPRCARCLVDHGKLIEFPFSTKADCKKNSSRCGRRLQASNLVPGVHVAPKMIDGVLRKRKKGDGAMGNRNIGSHCEWVEIVSVRRLEPGTPTAVYSLNVEKHHTYVTENGIVTGNCIYGWSGANAKHFMSWDVAKSSTMPKSYRCAPPIMAAGERCLQRLSDYWDRGIAPADHDGEVVESENYEDDLTDLRPDEDTLVLARTNRQVQKIRYLLEEMGTPFRYVKSKDGATAKELGLAGLYSLQNGDGISGEQWGRILEILPVKAMDGRSWLVRGSKAEWKKGRSEMFDRVYPEDLGNLGATEDLRKVIASGGWPVLCDGGQKWVSAAKRFGVEAVKEPKIRIGTCHSAKGMEADKVVLLTATTQRIRTGEDEELEKFAEERRIEYVACTRARHKLIVAHDPRAKYRMEIPL